jgi:hypothetical protein
MIYLSKYKYGIKNRVSKVADTIQVILLDERLENKMVIEVTEDFLDKFKSKLTWLGEVSTHDFKWKSALEAPLLSQKRAGPLEPVASLITRKAGQALS